MSRIAMFCAYWPTQTIPFDGIYFVHQVQALASLGHDVTVTVMKTLGKKRDYIAPERLGLDLERVTIRYHNVLRAPGPLNDRKLYFQHALRATGRAMGRCLRWDKAMGIGPDGIILQDLRFFTLSAPVWRPACDAPAITLIHGEDALLDARAGTGFVQEGLHLAKSEVRSISVVGNFLYTHMEKLGFKREDLLLLPNGASLPSEEKYTPVQIPRGRARKTIVSVSNFIPYKGVDQTISALGILSDGGMTDFELRVVGDGPLRAKLEALAVEKGIADKVTFLGRLPHNETLAEMSRSHIFCLPSWGEAFGIVYLEAMGRGRPVIGCNNCGPADFITNHDDGLLVPPNDPPAIARALALLWLDPSRLERIGQAGRRTAEGYTWQANAQRLVERLGL